MPICFARDRVCVISIVRHFYCGLGVCWIDCSRMSYVRLINQCGLYEDKIRIFKKNSACGLYTGALNRPKITVDQMDHILGVQVSHKSASCDVHLTYGWLELVSVQVQSALWDKRVTQKGTSGVEVDTVTSPASQHGHSRRGWEPGSGKAAGHHWAYKVSAVLSFHYFLTCAWCGVMYGSTSGLLDKAQSCDVCLENVTHHCVAFSCLLMFCPKVSKLVTKKEKKRIAPKSSFS